jgi:4-nitrophenyl phosphatase
MSFDQYFIDLDGTIYQGTKQFPSGRRFIERLRAANKQVLFVTNNSTKSPAAVADNLSQNHGIPTDISEVYTSAMATADYLRSIEVGKRLLVVGETGLKESLSGAGFNLVDQAPADAVVVALDRELSYEKLMQATFAIQQGAKFIATNVDTNLPTEQGMQPGAGAVVSFVQTATQTEPIVIGKPSTTIIDLALKRVGATVDKTIMVGDNYHTDIEAGLNAGMDTLLVYSGVATRDYVAQQKRQPTFEVDSLDDWIVD